MKVKEYQYNHYLCPAKLYKYIDSILYRNWYDCICFSSIKKEDLVELSSNVPDDVYPLVFEKASKAYIEKTGDATLDNYKEKKAEIEQYSRYSMNISQEQYPSITYSCPKELMVYVEEILKRGWYTCRDKKEDVNWIIFNSTAAEDVIPWVFERAKMEYISSLHHGMNFISTKEESNPFWVSFMMNDEWKTNCYGIPPEKELDALDALFKK